MSKRKPTPLVADQKEPADQVLNKFLQEHGILLATSQQRVTHTNDGLIVIDRPNTTAVYKNQVELQNQKQVN